MLANEVGNYFSGLEAEEAGGAVGGGKDVDADGVGGEQRLYALRPFEEAEVARIEVVLDAEIECFFGAVDAIKIKVIYASACVSLIFVDDSERGGGG